MAEKKKREEERATYIKGEGEGEESFFKF